MASSNLVGNIVPCQFLHVDSCPKNIVPWKKSPVWKDVDQKFLKNHTMQYTPN